MVRVHPGAPVCLEFTNYAILYPSITLHVMLFSLGGAVTNIAKHVVMPKVRGYYFPANSFISAESVELIAKMIGEERKNPVILNDQLTQEVARRITQIFTLFFESKAFDIQAGNSVQLSSGTGENRWLPGIAQELTNEMGNVSEAGLNSILEDICKFISIFPLGNITWRLRLDDSRALWLWSNARVIQRLQEPGQIKAKITHLFPLT